MIDELIGKIDADKVFVISAPSGAGKTSLNRKLVEKNPNVEICVSHTTRAKREGELEGVHYHFVERDVFDQRVKDDLFLEWANVHGNLYGTGMDELAKILGKGRIVVLEIDVQGWHTASLKLPGAHSLFILPPTMELLWKRLDRRGDGDAKALKRRLANAKGELERADEYKSFLINDDFEQSYENLEAFVIRGVPLPLTRSQGLAHRDQLLRELKDPPWL